MLVRFEAKGIFKGAEVNRDLDWEYGDDDGMLVELKMLLSMQVFISFISNAGGPGGVGKVLTCKQWHNEESYVSHISCVNFFLMS